MSENLPEESNEVKQTRAWTSYQFFDITEDAYGNSNAFQNWDCCDSGFGRVVIGQNGLETGPILTLFDGQVSDDEPNLPTYSFKEPSWTVELVRSASYSQLVLALCKSKTPEYKITILSAQNNFERRFENQLQPSDYPALGNQEKPMVNPISISPKLSRFAVLTTSTSLRVFELGSQSSSNQPKTSDLTFEDKITNHFQVSNLQLQKVLYVTTEAGVFSFVRQGSGNYKEPKQLSNEGVMPGFASTTQDGLLVCVRGIRVTMYSDQRESSSFEIEEDVRMIKFMKNSYLIAILASEKTGNIRIYNPVTHSIFGRWNNGSRVRQMLIEWNSVLLLYEDNSVTKMSEANMPEKIEHLIKNEQFDVALVVAQSQLMGPSVISEIHRQRGDSYQEKHQFQKSIDEYKLTIGFLEPSYVITRFIDPQHAEYLIDYLEALADKGMMTKEHTTLLFNCYTKLRKTDKLNEIIHQCLASSRKEEPKFNLETAVSVLCLAGFRDDALAIAKAYHMHDFYTQMLAEEGEYLKILDYIRDVETKNALKILKIYGNDMMISFNSSNKVGFRNYLLEACINGLKAKLDSDEKEKMDIDQLMRVFINFQDELYLFLDTFIKRNIDSKQLDQVTQTVWTTIIELCVSKGKEEEAKKYFQMAGGKFDADQLLLVFKAEKCKYAQVMILEHLRYYQDIIRLADEEEIPIYCEAYGKYDENVYRIGLQKLVISKSHSYLKQLIEVITRQDGLPLLAVLQILQKGDTKFDHIKPLARAYFKKKQEHILEMQAQYAQIEKDVFLTEDQTIELTYNHFTAKQTRCSGCHQAIDLPAKHFLCGHSFHLRCLGDDLTKCVVCKEMQEKIVSTKVQSFQESQTQLSMNDGGADNLYKLLDTINPTNYDSDEKTAPPDQFGNLAHLLNFDLMNPDDDGSKLKKAQELLKQYTVQSNNPQ